MKGMIFAGCSFTWGQGLWFYSDLQNMYYPDTPFKFDVSRVKDPELKYKDKFRFSKIVADHFETFDVQKIGNGGSEDTSFSFIDQLFIGGSRSDITTEKMQYNDVDYIILQTSQIYRNRFEFELNGETEFAVVWTSGNGHNMEKFTKWCEINNMSFDEWLELHLKTQTERISQRFKEFEELGIKTLILCWENDYLPYIKSDPFLNERFIRLKHEGEEFDSIMKLMDKHKHMEIMNDHISFVNPPLDGHPSKDCHKVIANSIISFIESNYEIPKTILPIQTPKVNERSALTGELLKNENKNKLI
jgi:hypothetical protein